MCFRCDAIAKVEVVLAGPNGQIPEPLKRVRDAITASVVTAATAGRARSLLTNLTRTRTLRLLRDLATGTIPLTHEGLDAQPPGFGVNYLRSLLVTAGVLPGRDEHLVRLQRFTTDLLNTIEDTQHRRLLARYAKWQVIGRARPDRHGRIRPNTAYRCRDDIRAAARFLQYLVDHGYTTSTCTQGVLDAWLAAVHSRAQARQFIAWLLSTGELGQQCAHGGGRGGGRSGRPVLPESAGWTGPTRFTDADQRWALVRRMLHDPGSGSLDERAAACLVLLYAQPVAKIVQLTLDDLHTDEPVNRPSRTYVTLGPCDLLLPPPLDDLFARLPVDKPFGTASTLNRAQRRWLFPGKNAGHHVHATSMIRRLNQLGVPTRAGRNATLLHIAATTPPAVFADLLGLDISTATRWTAVAGDSWMAYAAERQNATAVETTAAPKAVERTTSAALGHGSRYGLPRTGRSKNHGVSWMCLTLMSPPSLEQSVPPASPHTSWSRMNACLQEATEPTRARPDHDRPQ
ncbi:hypothetical protein [Flindersiella endophytica]